MWMYAGYSRCRYNYAGKFMLQLKGIFNRHTVVMPTQELCTVCLSRLKQHY